MFACLNVLQDRVLEIESKCLNLFKSLNSYYQIVFQKSHMFLYCNDVWGVRGVPYSCSLVFAVYSSKVKKYAWLFSAPKPFSRYIFWVPRGHIVLLAFYPSISSLLLLLQYHGQFHIFPWSPALHVRVCTSWGSTQGKGQRNWSKSKVYFCIHVESSRRAAELQSDLN